MNSEINKQLESKNVRPTAMRQLVLKVLMEQEAAISLSELELKFEKADKSTLFRTLKTFEKKKLIHSIEDGSGSVKYALCSDSCEIDHEDFHVHFLCTKCDHTYCLNSVSVPSINLPPGFLMETVNMIVKGICSECKK